MKQLIIEYSIVGMVIVGGIYLGFYTILHIIKNLKSLFKKNVYRSK